MRKVSIVLLALAFASTLLADVLHLKNGSKVEGRIVKETPEGVTVETQTAVLTYPRGVIERVERGLSPLDIYREKLAAAKTVEDYQGLLSWCEANRFDAAEVKERLRQAVAERRRAENPDTYCRECASYGQVGCEKCSRAGSSLQDRGTGKAALPCTQCGGQGTKSCATCAGTGKSPCRRCNSTGSVPANCTVCNGTGRDRCPRCGGLGTIACPSHERHAGPGSRPCSTCGKQGGPGQVDCPACSPYSSRPPEQPCSACQATGRISVPCRLCRGTGNLCLGCEGTGVRACSGCGRKGTVEGPCPNCQGEGLVPCAACQGTGISPPMAAPKLPAAR